MACALVVAPFARGPDPGDAFRFPPRAYLSAGMDFNRAYYRHLEARLAWEPDRQSAVRAAMWEADELYAAWDAARSAQWEFLSVEYRRLSLLDLARRIGWEAYWRGELPPCVPVWRFNELR